jgi:hypothetical protein
VLRDEPGRFDLRLAWHPVRPLRAGLLERELGTPYGRTAAGDDGWIIGGGTLEYRVTETETPYLLFSSPAYIRDPLDFIEASELPHLPSLASLRLDLERNRSAASPARSEDAGIESQEFRLANGVAVTLYSGTRPHRSPYLVGLSISIPSNASNTGFHTALQGLGVPIPGQIIASAFGADNGHLDSFAVLNNFALARTPAALSIWRRIESPPSWCEHLRPDLERCSAAALP